MRRRARGWVRKDEGQSFPHRPYGPHQCSDGAWHTRCDRVGSPCATHPTRPGGRSGCDRMARRDSEALSTRSSPRYPLIVVRTLLALRRKGYLLELANDHDRLERQRTRIAINGLSAVRGAHIPKN